MMQKVMARPAKSGYIAGIVDYFLHCAMATAHLFISDVGQVLRLLAARLTKPAGPVKDGISYYLRYHSSSHQLSGSPTIVGGSFDTGCVLE
jgi:hypothetical protein